MPLAARIVVRLVALQLVATGFITIIVLAELQKEQTKPLTWIFLILAMLLGLYLAVMPSHSPKREEKLLAFSAVSILSALIVLLICFSSNQNFGTISLETSLVMLWVACLWALNNPHQKPPVAQFAIPFSQNQRPATPTAAQPTPKQPGSR